MVGMKRLYSSYSYAMPGIGSSVVKFRMYSAARSSDCWLSFSAIARSNARSMFTFWRSSSGSVKPNFETRAASVKIASSPASTPFSRTAALSVVVSVVRTSLPIPVPAPRNGAPGLSAISDRRAFSMPVNIRSTSIICR